MVPNTVWKAIARNGDNDDRKGLVVAFNILAIDLLSIVLHEGGQVHCHGFGRSGVKSPMKLMISGHFPE